MEHVSIQPAGHAQCGLLAGLHARCFDQPWSEKSFRSILSINAMRGLITFAGTHGTTGEPEAAGFLIWLSVRDEAEIVTLGVLPAYRRSGIATGLLGTLERHAAPHDVGNIFLEVSAEDDGAIAFYKACGFEKIGRHNKYYSSRENQSLDALVFRKTLDFSGKPS